MNDLAVIMSVYIKDRFPFVKESVESILNQTYKQFHFYIVFDGPVSAEISGYLATIKDDRIRLHELKSNQGLAAALNYLLAIVLSNTDYKFIARMDADDVSKSERLEKQRNYLLNNPGITVLGTWYEEINESGINTGFRNLPCHHEELRRRFLTRTPFAHSSVMFRRQLIEISGYYPLNTYLMEDNALWGNALTKMAVFSNLPEYLHKFRINRDFYSKRSGFKYGWNYIKTKCRINRQLSVSSANYLLTVVLGLVRMLPPTFLKFLYRLERYL